MHRFFAERAGEDTARLFPEEARHALTVLRLEAGAAVQVILDGALYEATLLPGKEETLARLGQALPSPEPSVRVTLFQGLPKADKMDWIVQKCTEAGVHAVVPVLMERSVSRPSGKDGAKKAERWRRIAAEAAKQSGRAWVPPVSEPAAPGKVKSLIPPDSLFLIPWEEENALPLRRAVAQAGQQRDICLLIGPEGGISGDEIAYFRSLGGVPVTMGPRIFRTETAALAACVLALSVSGAYD